MAVNHKYLTLQKSPGFCKTVKSYLSYKTKCVIIMCFKCQAAIVKNICKYVLLIYLYYCDLSSKRSVLAVLRYKSKYKKVGVLPIRIGKSNVSSLGPS